MTRARRLSLAEASSAPLVSFLMHQSDVILLLCSGPAVWYFSHSWQLRKTQGEDAPLRGRTAQAVHQLRQVFTALLLGTELLARKATVENPGDLIALARRLNGIARDGIEALGVLGEPYPSDLLAEHGAPIGGNSQCNGEHP